jgi:hypothetical protein
MRTSRPLCPLAAGWTPALAFLVLAAIVAWFVRPEAFIADDAYFYLVVARNIALTGQQTFSGVFPTNGFHPLWCYLLAGYGWLVALYDPHLLWNVRTTIPLSAAVLLLGVWNGRRAARLMGLSDGILVGLSLTLLATTRCLDSEAILHVAALSYLLRISLDGSLDGPGGSCRAGLACAGLFLARLDSVFFIVCYLIWLRRRTARNREAFRATGVFLAAILPYLLANILWFGGAMPVSGWMKSSFPLPCFKGFDLTQGLYAGTLFGCRIVWGIIPLVASALMLIVRPPRPDPSRGLLFVYLGASLLQGAYIACFVRSHSIWAWYYVLPVALMALTAAIQVPRGPLGRAITSALAFAVGALVVTKAVRSPNRDDALWYPQVEALRYIDRNHLSRKTLLVSDWPGYIAFSSDNHIVAVDMLTSNRRCYEQIKASPNALACLIDACARAGKPVEAIIWMGNTWLVPDAGLRNLVFNDPRQYPHPAPIGRLALPAPPVYTSCDGGFIVWVP